MNEINKKFLPGYEKIKLLGSGTTGKVYLAKKNDGNLVAIKLLHKKLTKDHKQLQRLEKEAKITASLKHKNIIMVYDLINYEGLLYLIMEYCDKGHLVPEITLHNDIADNIKIFLQLTDALYYSHNHAIVHHDIKPYNIMMKDSMTPLICDFGLAGIRSSNKFINENQVFGTPHYMSPEKISGKMNSSNEHLSDIFSLGVLFYYLLSGVHPFTGNDLNEILRNIKKAEFTPLTEVNYNIPVPVNSIIAKMLRKDPAQRYQSLHDVADDFQRFQNNKTISIYKENYCYTLFMYILRHKKQVFLLSLIIAVLTLSLVKLSTKIVSNNKWLTNNDFKTTFINKPYITYIEKAALLQKHINDNFYSYALATITPDSSYSFVLLKEINNRKLQQSFSYNIKNKRGFNNETAIGYSFNNGENNFSPNGFFISLRNKLLTIKYPDIYGSVIFEEHLKNDTSVNVKFEKNYPDFNIIINGNTAVRINTLFQPQINSEAIVMIFNNSGSQITFQDYQELDKSNQNSLYDFILTLIYKNEHKEAITELRNNIDNNLLKKKQILKLKYLLSFLENKSYIKEFNLKNDFENESIALLDTWNSYQKDKNYSSIENLKKSKNINFYKIHLPIIINSNINSLLDNCKNLEEKFNALKIFADYKFFDATFIVSHLLEIIYSNLFNEIIFPLEIHDFLIQNYNNHPLVNTYEFNKFKIYLAEELYKNNHYDLALNVLNQLLRVRNKPHNIKQRIYTCLSNIYFQKGDEAKYHAYLKKIVHSNY